jgi:hypothetical protein
MGSQTLNDSWMMFWGHWHFLEAQHIPNEELMQHENCLGLGLQRT